MTARVHDPESAALWRIVRILTDPEAAKAAFGEFLAQRAGIHVRLAEIEMAERQIEERERQVSVREENVRRRETALGSRSE
jgi:hypothetical protein